MRSCQLMLLGLAACVAGAAEASYKRGDLLWKCDFTRAELPLVNGTNSYLREGRTWIANEGQNGDGAMRVKNANEKQCFMFGIPLSVAKFAGMIQIEADVKGVDLAPGPHDFNGPKIMFPFRVNGRMNHPQLPSEYGTFDWKTWVRVDYLPPEADRFSLVLGLEHAPGEFYIDAVRIYRAVEIPDDEAAVLHGACLTEDIFASEVVFELLFLQPGYEALEGVAYLVKPHVLGCRGEVLP